MTDKITVKLVTNESESKILAHMRDELEFICKTVEQNGNNFTFKSIKTPIGLVKATGTLELTKKDGGFLLSARYNDRMTVLGIVVIIIFLLSVIGAIIVIGGYYWEKTLIKNKFVDAFNEIKEKSS